jgi:hypothetical protein
MILRSFLFDIEKRMIYVNPQICHTGQSNKNFTIRLQDTRLIKAISYFEPGPQHLTTL